MYLTYYSSQEGQGDFRLIHAHVCVCKFAYMCINTLGICKNSLPWIRSSQSSKTNGSDGTCSDKSCCEQ